MFEKYLKRIDPKDFQQKGKPYLNFLVCYNIVTIVTLANTQLTQHDIGKFSRKKGKIRTSSNADR